MLDRLEFGDLDAPSCLVWIAGPHELDTLSSTVSLISSPVPFGVVAYVVEDWNSCLTPWPATVGARSFAGQASSTLSSVLESLPPASRYFLGGYSLAGLFSLWASCQTSVFSGVAAVSPSVWYPGFTEYFCSSDVLAHSVYLSLGDRESRTRDPVMATVGDRIASCYSHVSSRGVLKWNPGGHFTSPSARMASGFSWLLLN
ncbi:MAG: esterase [Saccharofermentans sp.]|nr:esterase [Saccharofermentans sp.]